MLDNTNQDASDSNNGKLNYHYADLIEKEKLLLQNLFKNMKIEPEEKKRKKQEIWAKKNRKKQEKKEKQEYYSKNRKKQESCDPCAHGGTIVKKQQWKVCLFEFMGSNCLKNKWIVTKFQ